MIGLAPQCAFCIHWRGGRYQEGPVCDAFPDLDGIPGQILSGEQLHDLPIQGDQGIVFEQDPKKPTWKFP